MEHLFIFNDIKAPVFAISLTIFYSSEVLLQPLCSILEPMVVHQSKTKPNPLFSSRLSSSSNMSDICGPQHFFFLLPWPGLM